jgi:hypothetical protein
VHQIRYEKFDKLDPVALLPIVNDGQLRKHLIEHDLFTLDSLKEWINTKCELDGQTGCMVRAVYIDNILAGWCGIQPDDKGVELAIVISPAHWGAGISIYKTLIQKAGELGHKEIQFHLLDSRPEYKALKKLACKTHTTTWAQRQFTTYTVKLSP